MYKKALSIKWYKVVRDTSQLFNDDNQIIKSLGFIANGLKYQTYFMRVFDIS